MNKKVALVSTTILLILVLSLAFFACGRTDAPSNDQFTIPQFANLNKLKEALLNGSFDFSSVTLKIREFDENENPTTDTTMYFGKNMEHSVSSVDLFGTGVKSNVEMFLVPDLTEKCQYLLMNNFMTNGWSYSKSELKFEKFDGQNFATLALLQYLNESEFNMNECVVTVENNTISFDIDNQKYTMFDFNNTDVTLPDELKDYKSKC